MYNITQTESTTFHQITTLDTITHTEAEDGFQKPTHHRKVGSIHPFALQWLDNSTFYN